MTGRIVLPRSAPETQGVASSAILDFVRAADKTLQHLHSFMLLRHGHVLAEGWWAPYGAEHPHMLFSLSKSFTSTAVGLAVAEGRLSVDDTVLSFFPEEALEAPTAHLAAMRVRHLLSMSTGHVEDTTGYLFRREDGNWVRAFLACPVERAPGTHFLYNSGASYMLSAIMQKLTGQTLLDYLQPRLFDPLGISGATWETCPRGINTGGWGLSIKTEDIARFGQLYLQKGLWNGQRLLPEAWVAEATSMQISNGSREDSDWEQGYGYQFWRCRHGAYRGDGAFGQYCLVMPEQDAVVAITAGLGDMQAVLNLIWTHLLPAMGPNALPADPAAEKKLMRKLSKLALPPQKGAPSSDLCASISGQRWAFDENEPKWEAMRFDFADDGTTITLWDARGEHSLVAGIGAWVPGVDTVDPNGPAPVVASGAWVAEDTYVLQLCYYETPFCRTLTLRFRDGLLQLSSKMNVSLFGPLEGPELVGRPA